jgi:hypothetical protein
LGILFPLRETLKKFILTALYLKHCMVQLPINVKAMIRTVEAIKPGPKPKKEDGDLDQRRRVTPEKKEQYPPLKPHKHKPKD